MSSSKKLFYLQARGHTGNSLLWWREGRHGYTNDIRKAHVFTREEAFAQHRTRPDTDFPWRKDYIDSKAQSHVVADDIGHEEESEFVAPAPEPSPSTNDPRIAEIARDTRYAAEDRIERIQALLAQSERVCDVLTHEPPVSLNTLQAGVQPWLVACFGAEVARDKVERNHRFIEEALELVQACGCTREHAHQIVNYVYCRPVGEPFQEVGGVMVTLAALCLANDMDMDEAGAKELQRCWFKIEQIRAKQAAKKADSALPGGADPPPEVISHCPYCKKTLTVAAQTKEAG